MPRESKEIIKSRICHASNMEYKIACYEKLQKTHRPSHVKSTQKVNLRGHKEKTDNLQPKRTQRKDRKSDCLIFIFHVLLVVLISKKH